MVLVWGGDAVAASSDRLQPPCSTLVWSFALGVRCPAMRTGAHSKLHPLQFFYCSTWRAATWARRSAWTPGSTRTGRRGAWTGMRAAALCCSASRAGWPTCTASGYAPGAEGSERTSRRSRQRSASLQQLQGSAACGVVQCGVGRISASELVSEVHGWTQGLLARMCGGPDRLRVLHLRKLVHLDLKSANVLLQDKNFNVAKIADLGLSKYLGECSVLDHTMRARSRELCIPVN